MKTLKDTTKKYRLITRSDMDGLVCAVLLKYLDMIDDIKFVHPKDMQDGLISVNENDIVANLPYVEGSYLVFDHHYSEILRNDIIDNHIIDDNAPSAAEVIYQYYGGDEVFPEKFKPMMSAVNKADSAQFSIEDITNPQDWVMLSFIMDSRTGLGRFREFRISNYQLMMDLIDYCKDHDIDEIMNHRDVVERIDIYNELQDQFLQQLERCSKVYGKTIVLDLTNEFIIYPGNRFMIYALNPDIEISIHKLWGFQKRNIVFAVGKSIVNRSSCINIGEIMLSFEGGGHANAGTCQVPHESADLMLNEMISRVNMEEICTF
jgi:nanoRNase/pAp phosphatase (c-di-AMP/oligoRNAs hydrolase)